MKGILGYTKEIVRRERERGRLVPFSEINPWPIRDEVGMGVAIQMLEKDLYKGKTEDTTHSLILSVSCRKRF